MAGTLADQLVSDVQRYRNPRGFLKEIYRTLFEENTNFLRAKPYKEVFQGSESDATNFFLTYVNILNTRGYGLRGRRYHPMRNLSRRVREAAYAKGIPGIELPLRRRGDEDECFDDWDDDADRYIGEDDGNDEEDEADEADEED